MNADDSINSVRAAIILAAVVRVRAALFLITALTW
jgi:hypothetical protein